MKKRLPVIFKGRFGLCIALSAALFICLNAQAAARDLPDSSLMNSHSIIRTISGVVTDEKQQPIFGATVGVKGTSQGTITDEKGAFTLENVANNAVTVFTYIGYQNQEIALTPQTTALNVQMSVSASKLNEVVVIGYGTARKKDLTGSVTAISSKDFNQGPLVTPEQLIAGKVAGVEITSNSGAPGAGSRIRIRGGASLNASNDPLIVIDGVPLDNNVISGSANALSTINPNDIETFNILKDASATAIYGNRGSNGVIIITTKKGREGALRISSNNQTSLSEKTGSINVLTGDELRQIVGARGNAGQKALLGTANTNWQDLVFRNAVSADNNLAFSGAVEHIPFRVSLGYLDQNGILLNSNLKRLSGSLNLNPHFLDNHLSIDANLRLSNTKSQFANEGAIGAAVTFDPTQSPYSGKEAYGGFFEWLDPTTGLPNTLAPRNPLGLLNERDNHSSVNRSIGSIALDYKFHFLPELRANLNMGFDNSQSDGSDFVPNYSAFLFRAGSTGGQYNVYSQNKTNKLLDFYFNYTKELKEIKSRIDATVDYSYQDFIRDQPGYPSYLADGTTLTNSAIAVGTPFKTQNTLVSFLGRVNYVFDEKYLLTASLRRDGSSRFSPENRWGNFPAVAAAWRIKQEDIFKNWSFISDLKARVSYGVTGQQDIGQDYAYLPRYTLGDNGAQYQFGNTFYATYRPEGYDANIKWETTSSFNAGLDYGFGNGAVYGSFDYYTKKTKDLLSTIPVPAGSNLTNQILTNVGNIENTGVEFVVNVVPVRRADFSLTLGFNLTYNQNKITNLTKVPVPNYGGILVGGISGGVGNTIQLQQVGAPLNSFYVYKQAYNENGVPIEGLYVDLNKDGKITSDDKYLYKTPEPKVFLGFNTQLSYRKLTAGFSMRAHLDNYVYNNVSSGTGTYTNTFNSNNYLSNLNRSVLSSGFYNPQYFSDYYIENASFLRMDNVYAAYNFGKFINNKIGFLLTANVQNVFTITKYSGLDPEVAGGIDNNLYPRPRVYSLGIGLDF